MSPEALARLHAAAFPDERGWGEGEFAELLAQPGAVLATDGPCFVLGRFVADEAEIITLATDPAARRRGHARRALATFEAAVRDGLARTIFLEVAEDNRPGRALYAAAGYSLRGRRPRYYRRPDGQAADALLLAKLLTPQAI